MSHWTGLLEGEYAERKKILADLTLEQVNRRLSPQSHSIYDELWHLVQWQNIVVNQEEPLYDETGRQGPPYPIYPAQPLNDLAEWNTLVDTFFHGLAQAYERTRTPEQLRQENAAGTTMADALHSLAVHNAYHFGKIVALRQLMGLWDNP